MAVHRLHPTAAEVAYTFGGVAPLLRIAAGDLVEVFTEDCFGGQVTNQDQVPSQTIAADQVDGVSGPIFVESAEPGDLLAVHFVSITPARDHAISASFPGFGALGTTNETAMLHEPLDERVWFYHIDLDRWEATFRARRSDFTAQLPLDPMHGVIGVAPGSGEVRSAVVPSYYGGNMDSPELRAGTTVYLPVSVPGALLALGDGHARQGEAEIIGSGLECAMNTVIAVDVVKGAAPSWPRFENDEFIMSTGSVRPLDDALRIAQKDMVSWVCDLTGMDALDSYQFVSQTVLTPVANMVDPNYTVVAKLAKRFLGASGAGLYGGVHARLSAIGRSYAPL
jgi:acetamidase/formamidase